MTVEDLRKNEIKAQVAEMEKAELITPAMKFGMEQLLDEGREKFAIKADKEEKEASRFELIKHLFSLAKGSDVNTDQKTVDGEADQSEKKDLFEKIDAEIEKYASDNKITYAQAYTVISSKYEDSLKAAE